MKASRWIRWMAMASGCGAAVMGVLLAAAWLALRHVPAWYDPPQVQTPDLPRVRASVPRAYQAFTDDVVSGGRFEFKLSARMVNEWIAARGALWPETRDVVPESIDGPVIAFENDRVIVAGRYARGDIRTIINARFRVDVDDATVDVTLSQIAAGALDVPIDTVTEALDRRLSAWPARRKDWPASWRRLTVSGDSVHSLRDLRNGVRFKNRFYWSNGERYFRILGVRARDGWLVLTGETL